MEHAALVGVVQGREGGDREGTRALRGDIARPGPAPHGATGEPLHHEQAEPLVLDEVVQRHDVRVLQ